MGRAPAINLKVHCDKSDVKEVLDLMDDFNIDEDTEDPFHGSAEYEHPDGDDVDFGDFVLDYSKGNEYLGVKEDEKVLIIHWSPYYTCSPEKMHDIIEIIIDLKNKMFRRGFEVDSFVGTCTI